MDAPVLLSLPDRTHGIDARVAIARAAHRLTWRVVAMTLALSMAVGVYNVYAGSDRYLTRPIAAFTYLLAGLCIMFATRVADEFATMGARRLPAYASALLIGASVGAVVQWPLHEWLVSTDEAIPLDVRIVLTAFLFFESLAWGAIIVFIYVNQRSALLARARMNAAQLARTKAQRRFVESRLQALQARVEPQFLFDTLARVRDRYEEDSAGGSRVLGDLIAYLRAALPHLREATSSLRQELALVAAYVNVMKARLGDDLSCAIEIAAVPDSTPMPAMILLPLVNHALRVAPTGARATIRIVVDCTEGKLRLVIAHSGAGFVSLVDSDDRRSIEQRLRRLYGTEWKLTLEPSRDGGTKAIVEIPYGTSDGDHR